MDELTYDVLSKMPLPHATLIALKDFENPALLAVKPGRTLSEYCWTCTPAIIKYCLEKYSLPAVTYVDADLFFFESARILLDEFERAGGSILLTEHRYTPKYDQSQTSGIYCVQFMTFRNDEFGKTALHWWYEKCLEWCYNRLEDGKFGDQKYLDDWPTRFDGVHVLNNMGSGVAPWNVQQYVVTKTQAGELLANNVPVVFYHFHNFKLLSLTSADLCRTFYDLNQHVIEFLYKPYLKATGESLSDIQKIHPGSYDLFSESWKGYILRAARFVQGNYYVMDV